MPWRDPPRRSTSDWTNARPRVATIYLGPQRPIWGGVPSLGPAMFGIGLAELKVGRKSVPPAPLPRRCRNLRSRAGRQIRIPSRRVRLCWWRPSSSNGRPTPGKCQISGDPRLARCVAGTGQTELEFWRRPALGDMAESNLEVPGRPAADHVILIRHATWRRGRGLSPRSERTRYSHSARKAGWVRRPIPERLLNLKLPRHPGPPDDCAKFVEDLLTSVAGLIKRFRAHSTCVRP